MTPAERNFMGAHEAHIVCFYEQRRLGRIESDCRQALRRIGGVR